MNPIHLEVYLGSYNLIKVREIMLFSSVPIKNEIRVSKIILFAAL